MAYYGLAKAHWFLGWLGIKPPRIANLQSSQAALKALELNAALPEAHAMLGALRALDYDWMGSERESHLALDLDPKSEEVWINYTWCHLTPMRRLDEAIVAMHKALERDPLSLISHNLIAYWHLLLQQWDRAIDHWRNTLELDPQYYPAHTFLSLAYIRNGMIDEGIRSCERALHFMRIAAIGWIGCAFALAGRTREPQELLEELLDLAGKAYVQSCSIALIYIGLGEIDLLLTGWRRLSRSTTSGSSSFMPTNP